MKTWNALALTPTRSRYGRQGSPISPAPVPGSGVLPQWRGEGQPGLLASKRRICHALNNALQPGLFLQVVVILLWAQLDPLALDISDIEQQIGWLRLLGDRIESRRSEIEQLAHIIIGVVLERERRAKGDQRAVGRQ